MLFTGGHFTGFAIALLIAVILNRFSIAENIMCKDDRGNPIDWFIAYKLPKFKGSVSDGSLLAYLDSRYSKWRLLEMNVLNLLNPLAQTLDNIFKRKDNGSMYAMYNDQITTPMNNCHKSRLEKGHTKGVIQFDLKSGYWLVHSVPHFPPSSDKYDYPNSSLKLGQTILCVSLSYKFLNTIGEMFLFNYPQFYNFVLPQKFNDSNPNLTAALEGKHPEKENLLVHQLTSLGGQKFIGFAKTAAYNNDLWTGIASALKSDLVVQSWRKGNSNLNSSCRSEFKVENVRECELLNYRFISTQDHAKWAVSKKDKSWTRNGEVIVFRQNSSPAWTCIGDINRQVSQKSRGGGAVCMDHPNVALNFHGILRKIESCTKKQP